MRFGYHAIGWRGPLKETLEEIAALGFQGVELFDLLDRVEHGEDVGRMLADVGLQLSGAYFGGSLVEKEASRRELSDFQKTADAVAELEGQCVIVGGGRLRRDRETDDTPVLLKSLNKLGRVANRAGVQMALHPHLGTLVETPEQIAGVLAHTDPELVKLAPDIAHLAHGGEDPVEFLRRHIDRVVYVHLKDLAEGEFVELGRGNLPIVEFHRVLVEHDYDGWATVELDAADEPVTSAQINARFVKDRLGGAMHPRRPR